ncbi:sporulation inhibitor of replication protein SirA [Bacillus sp. FJAT-44742]|uniref:sporulation inhibitor of replication protein SirA n=1 Tax=Bacillus sp. FJAT-44742 TaxID=2014005 RepID=UPI000C23B6F9|nr:sporulation inhibitor of replication protein SirA [Bacillus sp. FJAT-44742]
MNRYVLYLMEKEVAVQYYQSEDKLYRLFQDYERAYKWAKPLLEKQIKYVTTPIPIEDWLLSMEGMFQDQGFRKAVKEDQSLMFKNTDETASLTVTPTFMILETDGDYQKEWIVFDIIKQLSDYIFAINYKKQTFGWLKPLKVYTVL